MFDVTECRERCYRLNDHTRTGKWLGKALGEIERLQKTAQMYRDALDRSEFDLSCCTRCGEPVVCVPDGLPMCAKCAKPETTDDGPKPGKCWWEKHTLGGDFLICWQSPCYGRCIIKHVRDEDTAEALVHAMNKESNDA